MIQIILMEKYDWINEYKSFEDDDYKDIINYLKEAIVNKKHTTIQITKWDNQTKERL